MRFNTLSVSYAAKECRDICKDKYGPIKSIHDIELGEFAKLQLKGMIV